MREFKLKMLIVMLQIIDDNREGEHPRIDQAELNSTIAECYIEGT